MIIRQATVEDAKALRGRLRKQDYDEVWATHGQEPDEIVVACAQHSTLLWCAEIENTVVAVFGVAPSVIEGEGQPWMLGTDELRGVSKTFLRLPAEILPLMHCVFPVLRNMVDARNTKSIQWLARLGFTISEHPVPFGYFRMPFYEFYREEVICVR